MSAADTLSSLPATAKKPSHADELRKFSRRELLDQLLPLLMSGKTFHECAALLGKSAATLWRIHDNWKKRGTDGLATQHANAGRKKLVVDVETGGLIYTDEDRLGLARLRVATGSVACALSMWADNPGCSPKLREAILRPRASRHSIPKCLRQLCHVQPEIEATFRGARTYQLNGFVQQRDDTQIVIGADGGHVRVPVEPGDWWELDDQSVNQPFWWEDPAPESEVLKNCSDALRRRWGAAVGRQSLLAKDVRGKWLGCELVGRPRDAYRAADILRFLRRLFETHGLPRKGLRLERGIWKSKVIAGVEIPGMADEEKNALFGGLAALGLRIEWCYSPNHKGGIESGFSFLQTVESALALGNGYTVDLGRLRGEMERGAKALIQAHAGRKHPRDLGFLHIAARAERLWAACTRCNSVDAKEGRIEHGVPDEQWARSIAAHPLRALPKEKLWIFLPNEATVQLRGGHATGHVQGVAFRYCAPELFVELGTGYPVRIRYDATEPTLGAWVFNNAEVRDARNRTAAKPGDYLGWAEYSPDAPQFDAAHGFDAGLRKRYDARVRSEYRALGFAGRKVAAAAENRDGAGEVRRVERGAAAAADATGAGPEARGARIAVVGAQRTRTTAAAVVRSDRTAPPVSVEDFTIEAPGARVALPAAEPLAAEEW